jgi:HAD superfamily hydrolase (TIGR01549 family)
VRPYLFLDAGWTLLFPDYALFERLASGRGYSIPRARWERAMGEFGRYYDDAQRGGGDRWTLAHFLTWVLHRVGVARRDAPAMASQLERRDRQESLWCYAYPWVEETLTRLRDEGYRMSVISNADGRVRAGFEALSLDRYFEHIFDSHVVGFAKPDPRLFRHALSEAGVEPPGALYVGDLYYVDVLGANRTGMAAVHLDRFSLYQDLEGFHLSTVAELPEFLAQGMPLDDPRFLPLRQEPA